VLVMLCGVQVAFGGCARAALWQRRHRVGCRVAIVVAYSSSSAQESKEINEPFSTTAPMVVGDGGQSVTWQDRLNFKVGLVSN
jgi:hypothetical protein